MKQKIIPILIFILVLSVAASVTIYATTKPTENKSDSDVALNDEWVEREDVPQTTTYTLPNDQETTKDLVYENSLNYSRGGTLDIYTDKENENEEYRFEDDTLITYFNQDISQKTLSDTDVPITKDQALSIAEKHAKEMHGLSLDHMTLEDFDITDDSDFCIRYYIKYGKNNFICGPKFYVQLNPIGDVIFSVNHADKEEFKNFDKRIVENITEEEIKAYAEKQLIIAHGENLVSCKVKRVFLVYENQRFRIAIMTEANIIISGKDVYPTGKIVYYELET